VECRLRQRCELSSERKRIDQCPRDGGNERIIDATEYKRFDTRGGRTGSRDTDRGEKLLNSNFEETFAERGWKSSLAQVENNRGRGRRAASSKFEPFVFRGNKGRAQIWAGRRTKPYREERAVESLLLRD